MRKETDEKIINKYKDKLKNIQDNLLSIHKYISSQSSKSIPLNSSINEISRQFSFELQIFSQIFFIHPTNKETKPSQLHNPSLILKLPQKHIPSSSSLNFEYHFKKLFYIFLNLLILIRYSIILIYL
jgi:hypothetical protein